MPISILGHDRPKKQDDLTIRNNYYNWWLGLCVLNNTAHDSRDMNDLLSKELFPLYDLTFVIVPADQVHFEDLFTLKGFDVGQYDHGYPYR